MEIILASNSPRRKEILQRAGIKFKTVKTNARETNSKVYDEAVLKQNSLNKAMYAAEGIGYPALIIAADTVVILDSVCLVKPQNVIEALFMLKKLSNKEHTAATAHTIFNTESKAVETRISTTYVKFRKLSLIEIIRYVMVKKPFDKAGSYGIQDFLTPEELKNPPKSSFIKEVKGSYYNVMGLDIDLVLHFFHVYS